MQSQENGNILDEANILTAGDRREQYGHPLDNFTNHADVLRVLVRARFGIDIQFDAEFWADLMIGCKNVREAFKHGHDNLVDTAGYARCKQMVLVERVRRESLKNA